MDAHLIAFIPFCMLSVRLSDMRTIIMLWSEVAMDITSLTSEYQF